MKRLEAKFTEVKNQKRPALITYVMAYVPDHDSSINILNNLPLNGADIIELGMPFSDPMADGVAIQKAGQIALKNGSKLKNILEMVASFRKNNQTTPLILMGYYNVILNYGLAKFCSEAKNKGVDGLLIVDLPIEEEQELRAEIIKNDLAWIRLIAPTTNEERVQQIVSNATGFVYYVAVAGVTGTKSATAASIIDKVKLIKQYTSLPVAVGFGIKTAADVRQIAGDVDAVIVGSRIVENLYRIEDQDKAMAIVRELRAV